MCRVYLGSALCALSLLLSSCQSGAGTLAVDLRTDLVPGVEFTGARIVVDGERSQSYLAESTDLLAGARVATFENTAFGPRLIELELLLGEETVLRTELLYTLSGGLEVATLVVARGCRAVDCGSAMRCLGRTCVSNECGPEQTQSCGEPECTADTDCQTRSIAECARSICLNGACLAQSTDICEVGDYCDPELGCRERPLEPVSLCDEPGEYAPSNVSELTLAFAEGLSNVVVGNEGAPFWVFNTDTGAIDAFEAGGTTWVRTVRPALDGLHAPSGIEYHRLNREIPVEGLGAFRMAGLEIPVNTVLAGEGARPMVLLVVGDALIGACLRSMRVRAPITQGRVRALGLGPIPRGTEWEAANRHLCSVSPMGAAEEASAVAEAMVDGSASPVLFWLG